MMNKKFSVYSSLQLVPLVALMVILGLPGNHLNGQVGSDFELRVTGASVDYAAANPAAFGFSADVTVQQISGATFAPCAGYSIDLGNDPTLMLATDLTTTMPEPMGEEIDFDQVNFYPEGVTQGVVLSFVGGWTVTFEVETPMCTVDYQLLDGPLTGATTATVTSLSFINTLGEPPVENVLVLDGASFVPTTVDGTVTLIPHDGPMLIRGDASGDGSLDLVDGIQVLDYLFNATPSDCLDALDANDTGTINITDAVTVLCTIFCAGTPSPAPPYPACGFDPTGDALDCVVFPGCP